MYNKLVKPLRLTIDNSNSRLSFSLRVDTTRPWWRDLDLDGRPLYRIGNICDTCEAMFSKFAGDVELPIAPAELAKQFRNGLDDAVPDEVVKTVTAILPKGKYVIALLEFTPGLVKFNYANRTFYLCLNTRPAQVQEKLWPTAERVFPLWRVRKDALAFPKIENDGLYEAVFPIVDEEQLKLDVIEIYKSQLTLGIKPTALAFSLVDVRWPSGRGFEWQLVHFLLDGHHKLMAASQLGKPITLLSFLNVDESFTRPDWLEHTIKLRYQTGKNIFHQRKLWKAKKEKK